MDYIGIDIGSTASKVVVKEIMIYILYCQPDGAARKPAMTIKDRLLEDKCRCTVGRFKSGDNRIWPCCCRFCRSLFITEITCHARGGQEMAGDELPLSMSADRIPRSSLVSGGMVQDFQMNDKVLLEPEISEIMVNRLGVTLQELFDMADKGTVLPISSQNAFAEIERSSNYIGEGQKREDIAAGVVDSVANKVSTTLPCEENLPDKVILTGGLQ